MCFRKMLMNFAFKMVAVVLALGVMILGNVNITKADINLYNKALDYASKLNFIEAEKSFKSFVTSYPRHKKHKDAQYWLGRVYFAQKKYEEAAITLAEFNSRYPNDSRFQETTLFIAESAMYFAPKYQLCEILKQSLDFMINPSVKFVERINFLKSQKNCDDINNNLMSKDYQTKNPIYKKYNEPKPLKDEYVTNEMLDNYINKTKPLASSPVTKTSTINTELEEERAKRIQEENKRKDLERKLAALEKKQKEQQQSKLKTVVAEKPKSEFPLKPIPINFPSVLVKRDDIAVIIGNANYKKQGKDIPNVNPAYADAEGIKQYFMKAKGVREGNIIYLKDATNAQLLSVFGNDKSHKGKLFNYIKPNKSNVYIYYAGHGAPGKEGDAYLVPTDTDSQTIEFTGYPLSTLYSNLGKLPAKSMTVILEACFSGGSQSGSLISRASPIVIQPKKTFIPNNIKVIAAGSERQMASWEEDSSHSLFTKYFLKAMSGEGDSNKDGKVSDNELEEYLSDTMTYYARRYYGRDQKVQIHNGG